MTETETRTNANAQDQAFGKFAAHIAAADRAVGDDSDAGLVVLVASVFLAGRLQARVVRRLALMLERSIVAQSGAGRVADLQARAARSMARQLQQTSDGVIDWFARINRDHALAARGAALKACELSGWLPRVIGGKGATL